MTATDLQGRTYLTVAEAKPGTVVECDHDFTCMIGGVPRVIKEAANGAYLDCAEGTHCLDGQLSDDGTHYVGLYLATENNK